MRTAVSARCAGACPLRRTYTREGQPPTEREEKDTRLSTKRSQERHKTREHSKESPLVFITHHNNAKENCNLFRKKHRQFETKDLSLRLNKHNLFLAALRRPYSAKQMNYRLHYQRTRSLTYWKIPTFHQQGERSGGESVGAASQKQD